MKVLERSLLVLLSALPACGDAGGGDARGGASGHGNAGRGGVGVGGRGGASGSAGAVGVGGRGGASGGVGGLGGVAGGAGVGGRGGASGSVGGVGVGGSGGAGVGGRGGASGGVGGTGVGGTGVGGRGGASGGVGGTGVGGGGGAGVGGRGGASGTAGGDAGNPDADAGACPPQARVVLGAADGFAVLAGSTVTNTGLTMVTGDSVPARVPRSLVSDPASSWGHSTPGTASAAAEAALTAAYNDAAGRSLCAILVAGNLGGMTLTPGLYKSGSTLISSGDLVLDARGDSDAVFIFQTATMLSTTSGRQVTLIGGALAANVFWQVGSSATLGTTTVFAGTIMADQAISLATGATLTAGRWRESPP